MTRLPLLGFYTAHAINTVGTKMTMVALPLLVYATTGSAPQTGLVAFVEMGMYVVAKAVGAPFIDRAGRKRVGVGAELFAAVTIATVPLLADLGRLHFAVLLGLVAVCGSAQGLASAANRVQLPDLARRTGTDLERALAIFDGVDRLGSLLGAPLGGFLVAGIGAANVLWFDGASFGVSALLLALVLSPDRPAAPTTTDASRGPADTALAESSHATPARRPGPESYFASLRSGWRFLRSQRLLLAMTVVIALGNLLDQAKVAVLLPVWVTDILGRPALAGLIFGASGLGAVLGNLLFIWLAPQLPRYWTYTVCYLLSGAPQYLSLAYFDTAAPVIAIAFAVGFNAAALNPILSAVSFERVPDEYRTRVFGLTGALSFVGIPFGGLLGGLAVAAFGVVGALWLAGIVCLLVTLCPFVFPVWRELDRAPTPKNRVLVE